MKSMRKSTVSQKKAITKKTSRTKVVAKSTSPRLKSAKSAFDWTRRLRRSKGHLTRRNPDGSLLIFSMEDPDICFAVEGMAVEFWERLNGSQSLAKIMKDVASAFKVGPEVIQKDVQTFVKELHKRDLIG
jgi:hypothetical protein